MPGNFHYMPLYQNDWLASSTVQQMSVTAEGIYFRLCLFQWEDGALPEASTKLQRLARATDAEWAAFEEFLEDCFPLCGDGKRRNPRVATEREQATRQAEANRENGRLGGRPKKTEQEPNQNPNKTQEKPKQNPSVSNGLTETKPKPNPNKRQSESESESDSKYTLSSARERENADDDLSGLILDIGGKDPEKAVEAFRSFSGHLAEKGHPAMGITAIHTLVGKVKTFADASGVDPGELLAEAFLESTVRGWRSVMVNHLGEYAKRLKPPQAGSKRAPETMEEEAQRLMRGLI